MNVYLQAIPPPEVAPAEQKGRAAAACPAAAVNTGETFAALLEGIFAAVASSPKEEGKEMEAESFPPQHFEPWPDAPAFYVLPESKAPEVGIALWEAVAGGLERQLLTAAEPSEAVRPVEAPAGWEKVVLPAAEKNPAGLITPLEGAAAEAGKLPAMDISVILHAEEKHVPGDFPGSSKSNFLLAEEGDLSSGVQSAKSKQQKDTDNTGARPFAGGSAEAGERNEHLQTLLSAHKVSSAAPRQQESLKVGKQSRELNCAVPEESQGDPAGQLTLPAEKSAGKNAPPASFRHGQPPEGREALAAGKSTPLVSLPGPEAKELGTTPTGAGIGKAQERNSAAGQENRYPAFSAPDGAAAISTGGNSNAAPGGKAAFSPTAHPAEQEYAPEIMEQIVERFSYFNRAGEQELRLKLEPEFLGEVLIRVRRLKGTLSAEIITQHLAVKELLEGHLETLRQRFQQVNLDVTRFQVFVKGEGEGQHGFALAREHRGGALSPGPGGASSDDASGERGALPQELWEGKGRINYLV